MDDAIEPQTFQHQPGAEDWRIVSDGAAASFRGTFAQGARFVGALADLEGVERGRPDVDLRHDGVTVRVVTEARDYFGTTQRDLDVARRVSALAREHGLTPDPASVQSVLVIPAGLDTAAIGPFWRAVLGYEPRLDSPDEDLVDPHGRGPALWLEGMQEPRGDGGGAIHVAVWLAPEVAEERVAAALAAGGRLVRDDYAPAWWTLADAAGNEADIATITGRS